MDVILKNELTYLPYRGLQLKCDLIDYEGPLLSHFLDGDNNNILYYWIDFDGEFNRWLVWKASDFLLYQYLKGKISLKELIEDKEKDFVFAVDTKENFEHAKVYQLTVLEINESYLPNNESYYYQEIPLVYETFLTEIEGSYYLERLRQQAIYFKMSPIMPKYLTTVGALDASKFLKNLTQSYLGFATYDFVNKFKDNFASLDDLKKVVQAVKSQLNPRVVDLKYSSFSVALGSDVIMDQPNDLLPTYNESKKYKMWAKTILHRYNMEVVNINYSSNEVVSNIMNQYPELIRREIFSPFIDILNSPTYKVEVSDWKHEEKKNLKKITKSTKRLLITKKNKSLEPDSELDTNRELLNLVISVPKGKNLADIKLSSIIQNTLFSYTDKQVSIKYPNTVENGKYFFDVDNVRLKLNEPLTCQIAAIDTGSSLTCSDLDIKVEANDNVELYVNFNRALLNFYLTDVRDATAEDKRTSYRINYFSSIFHSLESLDK